MALKIFLDSDVVISSLISTLGAAYLLIHDTKDLELFISNLSLKELEEVVVRLNLDKNSLSNLVKVNLRTLELETTNKALKERYKDYVLDPNDAHILAGAIKGKVRFLISYNIRHFKVDKIRRDFHIFILTPGHFVQYLRSI